MLDKHKIESVGLPPKKIASSLPPVKEALGLKTPDIYSVSVVRSILGRADGSFSTVSKNMTAHKTVSTREISSSQT
jgi:hypothetical protein